MLFLVVVLSKEFIPIALNRFFFHRLSFHNHYSFLAGITALGCFLGVTVDKEEFTGLGLGSRLTGGTGLLRLVAGKSFSLVSVDRLAAVRVTGNMLMSESFCISRASCNNFSTLRRSNTESTLETFPFTPITWPAYCTSIVLYLSKPVLLRILR
jgi:hypothetical protein